MNYEWKIVSWDPKDEILTTWRSGDRYEDFFLPDNEDFHSVECCKHFGDGEYDSGTTISIPAISKNKYEAILRGVIEFHNGMVE